MSSVVLGIDLGTTNSCAAVMGEELVVIPLARDSYTLPSVVAYNATGEILVGLMAQRQAAANPTSKPTPATSRA